MAYLFLVAAILSEVVGTVSLKLSQGFTQVIPTVIVVVGYIGSFYLLSQSLVRGMPLGVAYGIWAACGVALVALIGALFLGESMSWVQIGGLALVAGGVLALEAGGQH
jgi:small multidrug resistance pump